VLRVASGRPVRSEEAGLIGVRGENEYTIQDDRAVLEFYVAHKNDDSAAHAHAVLSNAAFWGAGSHRRAGSGGRCGRIFGADPHAGRLRRDEEPAVRIRRFKARHTRLGASKPACVVRCFKKRSARLSGQNDQKSRRVPKGKPSPERADCVFFVCRSTFGIPKKQNGSLENRIRKKAEILLFHSTKSPVNLGCRLNRMLKIKRKIFF